MLTTPTAPFSDGVWPVSGLYRLVPALPIYDAKHFQPQTDARIVLASYLRVSKSIIDRFRLAI